MDLFAAPSMTIYLAECHKILALNIEKKQEKSKTVTHFIVSVKGAFLKVHDCLMLNELTFKY